MLIFRYDDTFEGLLTAVFDAFSLKKWPDQVMSMKDVVPLFTREEYTVFTDDKKVERVSIAMKKRLPTIALNQLTYVWYSELAERGQLIFRYLVKVFQTKHDISTNFADPDVLSVKQIAKKVSRERHYMMMFVRFNTIQNQGEKVYFATVDPRYNVLPFVVDFFKDRFADQKWAIFDTKRQFGYYFDLEQLEIITLDSQQDLLIDDAINEQYLSEDEKQFQKLWFRYCQALTIKERLNPKLQRQFMPKRFWKHLPETWHNKLNH